MKWLELASRIAVLLVLAILVLMLLKVELVPSPKPEPVRYEYKVAAPNDLFLEKELNEQGRQGWQVVFARRAMDVLNIASYEMILMREAR
jgi:hypothetical protein